MVFGQRGLRDGMENSGARDVTGKIPTSLADPPEESREILSQVAAMLDNRGMPFYKRMSEAYKLLDDGIAKYPEIPHLYLTRANIRFQNLDYHLAVQDFLKLGELLPGEVFQNAPLVRIAIDLGDYEEADRLLVSLSETDANDPRVLELTASLEEGKGNLAESCAALEKLLNIPGLEDDPHLINKLALLKLEMDDPQGALNVLEPIIEKKTRSSESYRIAGDALSELEMLDEARDSYLKSLHHNSGNLKARFNLGLTYREQGFNDRARTEYEVVIAANPNDPDVRLEMFDLDKEDGNREEAFIHAVHYLLLADKIDEESGVEKFVLENSDDMSPEMMLLYARYLIEIDELDSAIEILEDAANDPEIAPPFEVLLSSAYESQGNFKDAVEMIEKALDNFEEDFEGAVVCSHPFPPNKTEGGDFSELVCKNAELYLKAGDITNAEEALEELPENDSLAHVGKRIKGEIAFLKGDFETALKFFEEGLQEHPADIDLLASIGSLYVKQDKVDLAINFFTRAFLNDREDIGVIENLANLYLKTAFKSKARLFLNLIIELDVDDEMSEFAKVEIGRLNT